MFFGKKKLTPRFCGVCGSPETVAEVVNKHYPFDPNTGKMSVGHRIGCSKPGCADYYQTREWFEMVDDFNGMTLVWSGQITR